jgi:O-antigen ligase
MAPVPVVDPGPNTAIRWTLYLFVLSLPLDAPGRLPVELSSLTGAIFLLATLTQPRICYGRRPSAFWWFITYLYVYWLAYVLAPHFQSGLITAKSFLFYVQCILIFLATFNLMRYDVVTRRILITLVIAGMILAIMTVLGIGRTATESGRAVVLGQNPNYAARYLGAGLIALIGITYDRAKSVFRPRFIIWPLAAILGLAMIMGGSRGGLLALAGGLWTFSLAGKTIGIRIRNTVVSLLLIGLATWGALQSPLMQRRLEQAQQGNFAKRQEVFPAAWQMFKDRPLTGWGPSNQTVLAIRLRLPPSLHLTRDTHNLLLELLTATGAMGTIPFVMGVWLCCWAAWKARRGPEGILPTAFAVSMFLSNMSDNFIVFKLQWLLLAYALASGYFRTPHATRAPVQRRPLRGQRGSLR